MQVSFKNYVYIFAADICIPKPNLNITGMAHPGEIIKKLEDERTKSEDNDGLLSRFLLAMPKPVFPLADEILAPDMTVTSLER